MLLKAPDVHDPDPSLLPGRSWSRAVRRARDPGKDSRILAGVPKKGGGLPRRKTIKRWKLLTFHWEIPSSRKVLPIPYGRILNQIPETSSQGYLCWSASKHARQHQPRSQDLQVGVQKLIQAWYQRTCAVPGIWTLFGFTLSH